MSSGFTETVSAMMSIAPAPILSDSLSAYLDEPKKSMITSAKNADNAGCTLIFRGNRKQKGDAVVQSVDRAGIADYGHKPALAAWRRRSRACCEIVRWPLWYFPMPMGNGRDRLSAPVTVTSTRVPSGNWRPL